MDSRPAPIRLSAVMDGVPSMVYGSPKTASWVAPDPNYGSALDAENFEPMSPCSPAPPANRVRVVREPLNLPCPRRTNPSVPRFATSSAFVQAPMTYQASPLRYSMHPVSTPPLQDLDTDTDSASPPSFATSTESSQTFYS
eukprot:GILK01006462.1.p1 GENE.GILK01006462.1~~GILK01006462.1.p1  ORF type:complete len:156 (+),score=4.28 GILK01006462.1:47-469(+)